MKETFSTTKSTKKSNTSNFLATHLPRKAANFFDFMTFFVLFLVNRFYQRT